ncbi:MAG: RHS repeat-associated core domain-containing protein [Bryobacteraceae bacterium]
MTLTLIGASTNTGTWGQSFAYDGFGNMLNQTVTQGSAPSLALAYDTSTNRISTAGYGYDANGNMTASPAFGATYTYDASNRLVTAFSSNGTENYGYAPDNKRMYKKLANGEEQVHFYSGNQRLGIYKFQVDGGGVWSFATVSTQKYFGGRKLETMDRLGSDVRGTKYFPYGAEATVTANEKDKFGTYFRDTASNLDYADQRYYSSVIGRFMSPDPYAASGGAGDPGSWNRYIYTRGDPVNRTDRSGLQDEENPAGGCLILGVYYTDCDFALRSLFPERGLEPTFSRQMDKLNAAQQTFEHRENFSNDCRKGLAALGVTVEDLQAAANNVQLADGTQIRTLIANANGDKQIGNAQQFSWDNDPRYADYRAVHGIAHMTVADIFSASRGTSAWTPFGGLTIYVDPARINGTPAQSQALIMHELLHENWALDDTDVMNRLGISKAVQAGGSVAITNWMRDHCVNGRGNR